MTIQKRLEELRRPERERSKDIILHCAGPGFRIEGRYVAEDSDANTLALIPEHQQSSIAFLDLRSITFLEFRDRSEYQRAIGVHRDQASEEEINEFVESQGEATKLHCERKMREWNDSNATPKLRAQWPEDPSEAFRFNLLRVITYFSQKTQDSDELFRRSLGEVEEIVFRPGPLRLSREASKVLVSLSADDYLSQTKFPSLFDQLESVL